MSSASPADRTYIEARCHCSTNKFKIPFITSRLPLSTDLCHCNTCRHIHGAPVYAVHMHGEPLSPDSLPADLSMLSKYNASPRVTRYFCTICGASLLYELPMKPADQDRWMVSVGALERSEGVISVGFHNYVSDTLDGGLADFFPSIEGKDLPRYAVEGPETVPLGWQAERLKNKIDKAIVEDTLRAHCHCGRVSLSLKRPQEVPEPGQWWHVAPKRDGEPVRFLGSMCACTDCRLASGSAFTPFMYTTRTNIIDNTTDRPVLLAQDQETGGLKDVLTHYQSSPGVWRDFCPHCGAKVFYYDVNRQGGDVVDIFVGLIDEEQDGARAERWLGWRTRVTYAESTTDRAMLKGLQDGLKAHLL